MKEAKNAFKIASFSSLKELSDVARLLEINAAELIDILYRQNPAKQYRSFSIPKRNGEARQIFAPNPQRKKIQETLNNFLNLIYAPRPSVHGFRSQRSILSNANQHFGKSFTLNLDLKDFFPSINFGRIRGMFMRWPYSLPEKPATILAQICCFDNKLPQGAPTSPIISNMICSKLDATLQELARKYRCTYTRYADDITFSTTRKVFPKDLAEGLGPKEVKIGELLQDVIIKNGFEINLQKVRLASRNNRQEVTGLTVNNFPNVRRSYIKQVRAMLYAWNKFGLGKAGEYYFSNKKSFYEVLRGKIDFLKSIRGKSDLIYTNLAKKFNKLAGEEVFKIITMPPFVPGNKELEVETKKFDVFICHASEDKSFVTPFVEELIKEGIKVWYDELELKWGDSLRTSIDKGLINSKYGIVIFSKAFLKIKKWTEYELDALFQLEEGRTVILPLLHEISSADLKKYSPSFANRLYRNSSDDIQLLIIELKKLLR